MEQKNNFNDVLNELLQYAIVIQKEKPNCEHHTKVTDAIELSPRTMRHQINVTSIKKRSQELPTSADIETRSDLQGNSTRFSRTASSLASANGADTAWETPRER